MLTMGRRRLMIYTIDEISSRIRPVAEKYHLKAVYLFGSYARGEARDKLFREIVNKERRKIYAVA